MGESTSPRRGMNEYLPVAQVRPDPMSRWHEIESMVRRMKPGLLRDQLIDVLKTNYSDALDEAVEVTDG